MKIRWLTASLLAVGTLSLTPIHASAASLTSTSCSSGSVTATGIGGATTCAGSFDGNDTQGDSLLNALNGGLFQSVVGNVTWSLFGKSDDGNSSFTAQNGATSGTWQVLEAITGPFVISLKAGNSYSAYLFDGKTPVTSGTFETLGVSVNRRGNAQALSHASIFVAQMDDDVADVPEPASVAALGMIAIGGLMTAKKKRS